MQRQRAKRSKSHRGPLKVRSSQEHISLQACFLKKVHLVIWTFLLLKVSPRLHDEWRQQRCSDGMCARFNHPRKRSCLRSYVSITIKYNGRLFFKKKFENHFTKFFSLQHQHYLGLFQKVKTTIVWRNWIQMQQHLLSVEKGWFEFLYECLKNIILKCAQMVPDEYGNECFFASWYTNTQVGTIYV